jgi:hypothetical protein
MKTLTEGLMPGEYVLSGRMAIYRNGQHTSAPRDVLRNPEFRLLFRNDLHNVAQYKSWDMFLIQLCVTDELVCATGIVPMPMAVGVQVPGTTYTKTNINLENGSIFFIFKCAGNFEYRFALREEEEKGRFEGLVELWYSGLDQDCFCLYTYIAWCHLNAHHA